MAPAPGAGRHPAEFDESGGAPLDEDEFRLQVVLRAAAAAARLLG